jgi:hypothetical protein
VGGNRLITDEEARHVVGPRADYYLRAWATPGGRFNWAAMCWSGFWMAYRRMYWQTAVFFILALVETIAEDLVFVRWLGHPAPPRWLGRIFPIAVASLFARFGNLLYRSHVEKTVQSVRLLALAPAEAAQSLVKRGGTSRMAPVVALIAFVVVAVSLQVLFESALTPPATDEPVPALGNG